MIYLNNAATSYPKPSCVRDAVQACLEGAPVSQFRSAAGIGAGDIEVKCKENLGRLLGIQCHERIFFASGATQALNVLLCGAAKKEQQGEILIPWTEHNSVLRPAANQEAFRSWRTVCVPCDADGFITEEALEAAVTPRTKLLMVNHCSNVTGRVQDMRRIGRFAKQHGLIFLADVSQSAGCLPVEADAWGVDGLAFTGHKGLFGMQGCGGFYLRPGYEIEPLLYGGTGLDSARITYEAGNYEYEAGTQNGPGIASLYAGTRFILSEGLEQIMRKEQKLMRMLCEGLRGIPGVKLYGRKYEGEHPDAYGPAASMNICGLAAADTAYILQNVYGITVRAGLHCAPLIHQALGTQKTGTVRVSVSYFTTEEEIMQFVGAVKEIAEAGYENHRNM